MSKNKPTGFWEYVKAQKRANPSINPLQVEKECHTDWPFLQAEIQLYYKQRARALRGPPEQCVREDCRADTNRLQRQAELIEDLKAKNDHLTRRLVKFQKENESLNDYRQKFHREIRDVRQEVLRLRNKHLRTIEMNEILTEKNISLMQSNSAYKALLPQPPCQQQQQQPRRFRGIGRGRITPKPTSEPIVINDDSWNSIDSNATLMLRPKSPQPCTSYSPTYSPSWSPSNPRHFDD